MSDYLEFKLVDKRNVTIRYGDGSLEWDISGFDSSKIEKVDDLFKEFNQYLKYLGKDKNKKLWSLYESAHYSIITSSNRNLLEIELTEIVNDIYKIITVDDTIHWLSLYGDVVYPSEFLKEHDPDDRTPQGTYLLRDYVDLAGLALALRAMVVIWGGYLFLTRRTVGTDHKEYVAGRLITQCSIIDSRPMNRLQQYIEFRISRGIDEAPPVVDGLGTDEIPNWFLANILIRRLSIGEMNASKDGNLISNIFGFMNPKVEGMARVFGNVRAKYNNLGDDLYDRGNSILEMLRAKQKLTNDAIGTFNEYCRNVVTIATHVDPSIKSNIDLIAKCHMETLRYPDMMLHRTQEIIIQWIIAATISACAVSELQRNALLNVISACQALLLHWDLPDLAVLLISAAAFKDQDDIINNVVQSKIPNDVVEKILEISPHYTSKDMSNPRKSNYALLAINGLSKDVYMLKWVVRRHSTITDRLKENRIDAGGLYTLPCNISEQLARLTIILDKLRREENNHGHDGK